MYTCGAKINGNEGQCALYEYNISPIPTVAPGYPGRTQGNDLGLRPGIPDRLPHPWRRERHGDIGDAERPQRV